MEVKLINYIGGTLALSLCIKRDIEIPGFSVFLFILFVVVLFLILAKCVEALRFWEKFGRRFGFSDLLLEGVRSEFRGVNFLVVISIFLST